MCVGIFYSHIIFHYLDVRDYTPTTTTTAAATKSTTTTKMNSSESLAFDVPYDGDVSSPDFSSSESTGEECRSRNGEEEVSLQRLSEVTLIAYQRVSGK